MVLVVLQLHVIQTVVVNDSLCVLSEGGVLAGVVSDFTSCRALTCIVMMVFAVPMVCCGFTILFRTIIKGELNPGTNVGLNEYLREIKFCTGQESADVVQWKKIFNDKNHYLFTYFKNCVLREDGSSYRPYYTCIYATSAFTKTLLSERCGTNV